MDVATGGGGGARIGSGNSSSGGGWADRMGRSGSKKSLSGGGGGGAVSEIPLYSREDIREQYCINSRKDPLDSRRRSKGFFGCLTSRKVFFVRHLFCLFLLLANAAEWRGNSGKSILPSPPTQPSLPSLTTFTYSIGHSLGWYKRT